MGIYKSTKGKKVIVSLYEKQLKRIKGKYEDIYIDTSFGKTHLIETGNLLLSEYPPGSRPHKWHFPERNRLIAALSSIVLLAEAPTVHSGTIITAHKAIEYGKTLGIYLPAEDKKECFCGNITFLNDEAGFPLRNRDDLKMMLENNEL